MEIALNIATWILLGTGSVFAVIGGIGLLRLPDLFSRMHAGGVTDTMGAGLVLTGLMFQSGINLVTLKLVLILGFFLIASPTAAHALARSALAHGVKPLLHEEEDRP
jgi:multicomponent Na+:H+ antiporter subunit G